MNMTKLIGGCVLVTATALPLQARAQDVLTGDTRLACEAILCLATASPLGGMHGGADAVFQHFAPETHGHRQSPGQLPQYVPARQPNSANAVPPHDETGQFRSTQCGDSRTGTCTRSDRKKSRGITMTALRAELTFGIAQAWQRG